MVIVELLEYLSINNRDVSALCILWHFVHLCQR